MTDTAALCLHKLIDRTRIGQWPGVGMQTCRPFRSMGSVYKSGMVLLLVVASALFLLDERWLQQVAEAKYRRRQSVAPVYVTVKPAIPIDDRSHLRPIMAVVQTNKTIEQPLRPMDIKRILGFRYDIYLYSAIVGNSSTGTGSRWNEVYLQGWEHRSYINRTYRCCFKYRDRGIEATNMKQKIHWQFKDKTRMAVKQYVCPAPKNTSDKILEYVTIAGALTACNTKLNWYLKPLYSFRQEGKIGVCAKFVYGGIKADDILSWFEIHRRLGVDKVLTYTFDLNHAANQVLMHYRSLGIAEITPFTHPKQTEDRKTAVIGTKNLQAWNDEQLVVYDCLERLRGYQYVMMLDMDEYLVPRSPNTTLKQLFNQMFKRKPKAAGFYFMVQVHVTSWDQMETGSEFKVGQYLNSTVPMKDRMKVVTIPSRLAPGGLSTHNFSPLVKGPYKRYMAEKKDAIIHHYRSCRKEWLTNSSSTNSSKIQCYKMDRYTDYSVANLMKDIEPEVVKLKNEIYNRI